MRDKDKDGCQQEVDGEQAVAANLPPSQPARNLKISGSECHHPDTRVSSVDKCRSIFAAATTPSPVHPPQRILLIMGLAERKVKRAYTLHSYRAHTPQSVSGTTPATCHGPTTRTASPSST